MTRRPPSDEQRHIELCASECGALHDLARTIPRRHTRCMGSRGPASTACVVACALLVGAGSGGGGKQSSAITTMTLVATTTAAGGTRRGLSPATAGVRARSACRRAAAAAGIGPFLSALPTTVGVARRYQTRVLNDFPLAYAFSGASDTAFAAWCWAREPALGPAAQIFGRENDDHGYLFYVVGPRDETHEPKGLVTNTPPSFGSGLGGRSGPSY
jgi:hypothetical protein